MKLLAYMPGPLFDALPNEGGGGGAGTPAAFDPAAFRTQLLGDVTKLFGSFTTSLKADFAKLTPTVAPPPVPVEPVEPPAPITAATGGDKTPAELAFAAQIRAMERRLKDAEDRGVALKTESDATRAAADKKELDAAVRTELSKFQYADAAAAQDAFDIFGSKIKRNEDGDFGGPDGTPIALYLAEAMRSKPYLLAMKDTGGAGARPGGTGGPGAPGKAFDLNNIKPGMKAEDLAAASARISEMVKLAMQGQ